MRQRFGRWEVRGALGAGGMGHVWRCEDPATGEAAAVKVARVRSAAREALQQEIAALLRLSHPGLVRFLEHGADGDEVWVATALVAGRPLRDRVASTHPSSGAVDTVLIEDPTSFEPAAAAPARRVWTGPDLRDALAVVHRLCEPLAWLHGEGFVHGDVKPENVLVTPEGGVVLVDLGLARTVDPGGRDTLAVERRISGTAGYLSPEQCHGRAPDGRSDLYAVGCLLFELLCGEPPFGHGTSAYWAHRAVPAPSVGERVDAPPAVEALVSRLLEKDPQRRLAYATDVSEWLEGCGIPAPPRAGPAPRHRPYRPPMVGRSGPRAALVAAPVARLAGEAGIGKTRLLSAVGEDREVAAVVGVGSAPGGVARTLLASLATAAAARRATGWFAEAPEVLRAVAPELAELVGVPPATDPPDGEVVDAVLSALAAAAPLRVLLDDLADPEGRDAALCRRLARQPPAGVSVVFAGAGPELAAALERLGVPATTLGPLDEPDLDALVQGALGDDAVPIELLTLLRRWTGGNPRQAVETLQHLVATGALRRRGGCWALRDRDGLEASGPPTAVDDLLRARLAALPPALRQAAGRAATGGFGLLTAGLRDQLRAEGLAERRPGGWRFLTPLLGDLAAEALSDDDRRAAHRDALAATDLDEEAKSDHLLGLGRSEEAAATILAWLPGAAEAARWSAVTRWCTRLLAAPLSPEAAGALSVFLAQALRARGRFQEAVDALAACPDPLSTPLGRDVRFQRARALARTRDTARAVALLEEAVDAGPDRARWLEALAETLAEGGDLQRSAAARREALALRAAEGDPVAVARGRLALASTLQRQDRVLEARGLVDEALRVLDATPDRRWRAHGHALAALVWSITDEDRARSEALVAIRLYREVGLVANEAQAIGALVDCLRRRSEHTEALQWLSRMEALADEVGAERIRSQAAWTRASLLYAQRDPRAREVLEATLPRLHAAGFVLGEALANARLATLLRESGAWDAALPHLDRLAELAELRDDLGLRFYDAVERAWQALHRGEGATEAVDAARRAFGRLEHDDPEDREILAALEGALG